MLPEFWYIIELDGGGRVMVQADSKPDCRQTLRCAPRDEHDLFPLTVAANRWQVVGGPMEKWEAAALLHTTPIDEGVDDE